VPYLFTVSPDFSPRHAPSWFVFNTWLQRALDTSIHLELSESFASQRQAILEDRVDLIYANPFDAATLVRQKGFRAVAAPRHHADEAMLVVAAESPLRHVRELKPGLRVSSTGHVDVHTMAMILLEPADLDRSNITLKTCPSYVLVAKDLLHGDADLGFFLEASFRELSALVRDALRPIAKSSIHVVRHCLLAGPKLADKQETLARSLTAMDSDPKGGTVLEALGIEGWEALTQEDIEFMIDLMDTLVDPGHQEVAAR